MSTYFAVCDAGGPISVAIEADTIEEAIEQFERADARRWIDGQRTDAEDELDIDGSDMDEEQMGDALRAAGYEMVRDLSPIINAHAGTVAHLAGGWRLWAAQADSAEIRVIGLGADDWTGQGVDDEAADYAERVADLRTWERYGTVRVAVGAVTYEVGCVIGVPEHLRSTARAAGGDTATPYLDAWYADATDWMLAPASTGPSGISAGKQDAVLAAIAAGVGRLWSEA